MKKNLLNSFKVFSIIAIFTLFIQNSNSEIIYVDTIAKGKGENLEVALKKAFKKAISKVNGVSLETDSVLKTIDKKGISEVIKIAKKKGLL